LSWQLDCCFHCAFFMSCGEVNKPWAHRAKARGHVHKQEVRVT
jgi:hypothetical protein